MIKKGDNVKIINDGLNLMGKVCATATLRGKAVAAVLWDNDPAETIHTIDMNNLEHYSSPETYTNYDNALPVKTRVYNKMGGEKGTVEGYIDGRVLVLWDHSTRGLYHVTALVVDEWPTPKNKLDKPSTSCVSIW